MKMAGQNDSTPEVWDCIVVGGGVVGCCTAYHLTKQGKKVLILEQFCLPHSRGSSHGQSRIMRRSDGNKAYAQMSDEAYLLWSQIERESGKVLFRETGMLTVQGGNHQKIDAKITTMINQGLPLEKLSHDDLMRRYPMVKFPCDYKGVLDVSGGILLSERCLSAIQRLITADGGRIRDGEKVEAIWPGSEVTIHTNQACYKAHKVVLTPGPWAGDLLRKIGVDLPLKTLAGKVMYWRSSDPNQHTADDGKCPIIIHYMPDEDRHVYSTPSLEYPSLVKIVRRVEGSDRYCHPDERDRESTDHMVEAVAESVRQNYPGVSDKPSVVEPCMYTMTPDKKWIIDRHPLYTNIIFGVGMSGQGFMLAPVTGKLLAEMVLERKPSYSLVPFKLTRFKKEAQSKL